MVRSYIMAWTRLRSVRTDHASRRAHLGIELTAERLLN
jgi:hypothetical protein